MLRPGGNRNCLLLLSPWHTGSSGSEGMRREERKAAAPFLCPWPSLTPVSLLRICVGEINTAVLASLHILLDETSTKTLKVHWPKFCQFQSPNKRERHSNGMKNMETPGILGCTCRLFRMITLYLTLYLTQNC